MSQMVKGFGRRRLAGTVVSGCGAGVRKPPKEETAGRLGPVGESAYGDL